MTNLKKDAKILDIVKDLMTLRKALAEVNQLVFTLEQKVLEITPSEKKGRKRNEN